MKLVCLLCYILVVPCEAMNLKKVFCRTQNIFKAQQIRKFNNNIEFIIKFYSDKIKHFKDDDFAAKAMKKLFKQSNLVQQRRFLRELDNYHIMEEYRKEFYRLETSWTLYKIFSDCMNDFNKNAQKNKTPLYEMIKVHSEESKAFFKTADGWMSCPHYRDSWKNGKTKYGIARLIMDPDWCEKVEGPLNNDDDPSKGNPPY